MGKLIVEVPDGLHARLKQQAAADHQTLKIIVTALLDQYLAHPGHHAPRKATGLCGAWKDRRDAEAVLADVRSARRWRIGTHQA
ncbi:MAG: hypothetical protein Q8R91_04455 [Candidatus Omnitrophota bacterium]|nr:hypothetical protein [Candidatus Omnitrophota bacterium]